MADSPVYDLIAKEYQKSKQLPFRLHIEEHSLFKLLGDLQGKRVLDVACGEGIYTRKIKRRGAQSVLGVDISPRMINLAISQEREPSLACEYLVSDVAAMGQLGEFDVVVGVYLLNYAKTVDELRQFCQVIAQNLCAGGAFVGINDNPANPVEKYDSYGKYGFWKTSRSPRTEGAPITYRIRNADGTEFGFDNYYLSPATYETVFKEVGFADFAWLGPWLSDEGRNSFEEGYWDHFLDHPPMIAMLAHK